MLALSMFGDSERVTLLELSNFVTHNAKFSWNKNEEGVLYQKLYNENTVSKKAVIDLNTFHRANLGCFGVKGDSSSTSEYCMD